MKIVTLKGPGRNALGTPALQRLIDELGTADGEPVLLTGAPGAFSAGLDLKEVGSLDAKAMAAFLRLLEKCMTALYLYPGPTAAAVNGHAIAGGCVLTLCCDVRIIADDPSFKIGLNEVALGLRFPPRTLAIVRSRLPKRFETEVLLGSALLSPKDAFRVGMVDAIATDVVAVAAARLASLSEHPREAYAQTKRDLRGTEEDLASDSALERWLERSVPIWTSHDARARIASVLTRK